ncbi:VWA domain-containing protein [Rhodobacter capsulatus]|uniref:vWA domain-containing protein n=1 Tax=Rhodobacter capsulatus TaxID=1061 RepID=UPI0006DC8DBF|nr:vWA domain-containing protein [Rhodobacter capsulatus]KQB12738.1 hypothetical protein AP073_06465 [Rhodobacter capsulatus]KQB15342.1 hypothetical protein AP071_14375 [Rhodobacter capsulatus]PZX26323.1 von Willebrand factor type A domain-containing protein [Rhodobacter capsulatus]QNR61816.1 VWA domain-containing protein [Rhodobacter capsulatus]
MDCTLAPALALHGDSLQCLGGSAVPWALAAAAAALGLSLLLALRDRRRGPIRFMSLASVAAALWLLALATERPVLTHHADQASGGQIVVVLDNSESFWRDQTAARDALQLAARRIDDFAAALPPEEAALWRGQLVSFGAAARIEGGQMALPELAADLRRRDTPRPAAQSALASGLRKAEGLLSEVAGRRLIVLVSDGLTPPPEPALHDALRAAGIAVHVVIAGASAPGAGLVAADLGPEFRLGDAAVIRVTTLGAGQLGVSQDRQAQSVDVAPAETLQAARLVTRFARRGLQGLRLSFATEGGQQSRDLFTLVRGPARLLVFGPAPWAEALPARRWQITRARPEAPPDPGRFDLVVIDAAVPADFPQGYDRKLLQAADGTGLFLINGGLRDSREKEQRISDWGRSALAPILPVDSDPRAFQQEPPPRDIVIMVDVSGSMAGTRLGSAQSAIQAILRHLRPRDTVAILPFADVTMPRFEKTEASPSALAAARRFAAGLTAGGGTAPDSTIRASAGFVSNYCAFFFISDAEFDPPATAPQCFTTAISVSNQHFAMDIDAWGEEIRLGEGGNAEQLELRYFTPEPRTEYFREGGFAPLAVDGAAPQALPRVEGLAISYPRQDATVRLLHETPPPDPLFALRRDSRRPGVVTGAFLGPMGRAWSGKAATEAMLSSLLGWPDQDRYLLQLEDEGAVLRLWVTVLTGAERAVSGQISATLQWPDGATTGIALEHDARRGGWTGSFARPAQGTSRGLLTVQDGADVQRIPVQIPDAAPGSLPEREALQFGVDLPLLTGLAQATSGTRLDLSALPPLPVAGTMQHRPLHGPLIVIAFLLLAATLWLREVRR